MRVALLIDREQVVCGDIHLLTAESKRHAAMEFYLAKAMRELGHEVVVLPCRTGRQLVRDLTAIAPDVAFNATEHLEGDRTADVHVAALLESLKIPYTGGSPATLVLCRDKATSKSLAAAVGVRVPQFAIVPIGGRLNGSGPPFPVVVKPASRDSSEGIGVASFVETRRALESRVGVVPRRYRDVAIIEAFVPGMDVSVFVVEGKSLQIHAPHKREISAADPASPHSMATYHVKHNAAYRAKWKIRYGPISLPAQTMKTLRRDVAQLWPVLQLRDYGRFDFRLDEAGELVFIEANANPGFSPVSRTESWKWPEYVKAVRTVIGNARQRFSR